MINTNTFPVQLKAERNPQNADTVESPGWGQRTGTGAQRTGRPRAQGRGHGREGPEKG